MPWLWGEGPSSPRRELSSFFPLVGRGKEERGQAMVLRDGLDTCQDVESVLFRMKGHDHWSGEGFGR